MTIENEVTKIKHVHPLWTHLPALAVLAAFIIALILESPLPANAPVHWGFHGNPDSYGSPWPFMGFIIGFSVFFIALSAFLDELWARQEKKKSFNWFSMLDEITIGWMVGLGFGYLAALGNAGSSFNFPWLYGVLFAAGTALLSLILELLRPYHGHAVTPADLETKEFEKEISQQLKDNTSFMYWDSQNPWYITLLSTALPVIILAAAVVTWFSEPWAALIPFAVAILLIIPYGGQRTLVTRQGITIRWGIIGIKALRLNMAHITAIELHEFSPLRDFGGYGIRINKEMTAYYLNGNRGVKVTMANGKKYLLGSNHPERLLTVLQMVSGRR